ncbi:hypothetical protein [Nocardia vulneris]|nr:hypothetical protein [Nocardia vulneris]
MECIVAAVLGPLLLAGIVVLAVWDDVRDRGDDYPERAADRDRD